MRKKPRTSYLAAVWLPVDEYEPPMDGQNLLVWQGDDGPDVCHYDGERWIGGWMESKDSRPHFTHWSEISNPHERDTED